MKTRLKQIFIIKQTFKLNKKGFSNVCLAQICLCGCRSYDASKVCQIRNKASAPFYVISQCISPTEHTCLSGSILNFVLLISHFVLSTFFSAEMLNCCVSALLPFLLSRQARICFASARHLLIERSCDGMWLVQWYLLQALFAFSQQFSF